MMTAATRPAASIIGRRFASGPIRSRPPVDQQRDQRELGAEPKLSTAAPGCASAQRSFAGFVPSYRRQDDPFSGLDGPGIWSRSVQTRRTRDIPCSFIGLRWAQMGCVTFRPFPCAGRPGVDEPE